MYFRRPLFFLLLTMNAHAGEKPVYVGEGRYVCESRSVDCAVLKQRNAEQTHRKQERDEYERRYEGEERRKADRQREYESSRY